MSKNLTMEQKRIIEKMVKEDFECGLPEDDFDELKSLMKEDPDLCSVAKKAAEYYFDLIDYGPAGFYEAFHDDFDDWDDGFVAEYSDLDEDFSDDDEYEDEDYDDIEEDIQ